MELMTRTLSNQTTEPQSKVAVHYLFGAVVMNRLRRPYITITSGPRTSLAHSLQCPMAEPMPAWAEFNE